MREEVDLKSKPNNLSERDGVKGGSTPGASTVPEGSAQRIEKFKRFLKMLSNYTKYETAAVLVKAIDFVQGFGLSMETLDNNPPLFYRAYDDELIFVWPSGLTLSFRLIEAKHDAVIMIFFDHLARSEVFE